MSRSGRRRVTITLLIGIALLLLVGAAVLLRPAPPLPASGGGQAGPLPEVAPMPPLASFDETTARPLFLATRSQTPAEAGPATGNKDLILGRYAFVGAVAAPGRSVLLLAPAAGGPTLRVREGEALDGWKVLEIGADYLRLARDGEETTVPLVKP
ncbi:MAG: hypothetical protein RIM84_09685 [Alphaproteobacteria bacterium]